MTSRAEEDALVNHWYWRPGWGVGTRYLIWYLTWEDHPAVRRYLSPYRAAVGAFRELDVVPEGGLHTTLQGVGHARDHAEGEVAALVAAAGRSLAGLRPPTVTISRPEPHREAVLSVLQPPEGIEELRAATRAAMVQTFGDAALLDAWPLATAPHLSIAYAAEPLAHAPVRAALAAVPDGSTHGGVRAEVRAVSLVELHRDHREYQWRTLARVPIGGSRD